jgi:hypothetical protein
LTDIGSAATVAGANVDADGDSHGVNMPRSIALYVDQWGPSAIVPWELGKQFSLWAREHATPTGRPDLVKLMEVRCVVPCVPLYIPLTLLYPKRCCY